MSIVSATLMLNHIVRLRLKPQLVFNVSKNFSKMNDNLEKCIKQLAPPLTNNKHKGQAGRIGVFGGSLEYTGAPYFAAIASLKVGADLSHVFCAKEAAAVIKSYSPELIVHPLLDAPEAATKIEPWLDRLHVILIGPGLGREENTFKVIDELLLLCRSKKKPLVIDADGLYYLSLRPEILRDYPSAVILTPNVMEFSRLIGNESSLNGSNSKMEQSKSFLSISKNLTILCKGRQDEIFNDRCHVTVPEGGSGRRCGGQGDLLSGAVSTFLAWALDEDEKSKSTGAFTGCDSAADRSVIASYAACKLAKDCNQRAFAKFGRSMTCSDMLHEIHEAFEQNFENS